ncbi:MAG: trypsin-like peptidase domain-containing protein [Betaproteobacteria bacterium]
MQTARTLYTILGVASTVDADEIERAFQTAQAALHQQENAADALSLLRVAYDTLRHPDKRAAYDRRLARQAAAANAPRPAASPSGRRFLAISLVLLAGGAAAFWLRKPAAPPPMAEAAVESRPVSAVAAPLERPAEKATAPAIEYQPPPAFTATAEPVVEPVTLRRGARKSGFDAEYLGWSVFVIRQRGSSGSGVLIAPDKILTNCHVLAGAASNGMIVTHTLTHRTTKVEKYARLDGEDACLVYAPGAGGEPIEWGNSGDLRHADTLYTFGHPGGSANIVWSEGKFLGRAERAGQTFLFSANYCRPGSSGGPLLDEQGRLVGIVTAVQRYARAGEAPAYGNCISVTEATAKALLSRPLFPIALAPAQYIPAY